MEKDKIMSKELLDIYSDYLISQSHHATATGIEEFHKSIKQNASLSK